MRDLEQNMAQLLKAAGDLLRLKILRVLKSESFGVQELAFIFDMPQPGMSHHLKVLNNAGLVKSRREANTIFYRRQLINSSHPLAFLVSSLYHGADLIELDKPTNKKIKTIHTQRRAASVEFFNKNADNFSENQERIAVYDLYREPLESLILESVQGNNKKAFEIGPGAGDLLSFLSNKFNSVIAIDNSLEMLNKAKKKLSKIENVQYIHSELSEEIVSESSADLLVLNMVLHHFSAPAEMFKLFYDGLHKGGILVIADLCKHHQEWVHEACGDIWMGFDPDEVHMWANQVGFQQGQSLYIGLKNGFQIQLQTYLK